jgi:hypothetical protein
MVRTTLALDERVMARIREKSRLERRSLQACTNELLMRALEMEDRPVAAPPPLPILSMGAARVDISDRDALMDFMDTE